MVTIENDDDAYLAWLEANPDGFVVNAEKQPRASTIRLHRVRCQHISTPERSNWTTAGYLKVCSNLIGELEQWADRAKSSFTECGVCKPLNSAEPSGGINLTPLDDQVGLPFDTYPHGGRKLLGRRSVTNSRRGYGLELRKLTNQSRCVYCGIDIYAHYENWLLLQVDHVIPTTMGRRLGVSTDWLEDYSNLVLACSACNTFENQFDDKSIVGPPRTVEDFFDLRDRVFLTRKPQIQRCQQKERQFFDSKPWSK